MASLIVGTGLTSMVGSRFVELFQNEFEFVNLDLASGVDITNQELVAEKISQTKGEIVIHFAAFTDVDAAHQQKDDINGLCYRVNVVGTKNISQACSENNKYLIHISTDFVFDGNTPPPGGYTEDSQPHPIEWYGQTKLLAERQVKESGAKAVIIRISYPYRANFPAKLDLVRKIITKMKDGTLPPMFTDHIMTPTFIDDISQTLRVIIDKRPEGIFHVVGSSPVSDYELAQTITEVFELDKSQIKPGSLEEFLKTASRPYQKRMITSNAKLKIDLGVSMSTLSDGLTKMKQQTINYSSA